MIFLLSCFIGYNRKDFFMRNVLPSVENAANLYTTKKKAFEQIKTDYKSACQNWNEDLSVKKAITDFISESNRDYVVDNYVVFNRDIEKLYIENIKYIVVADNPGMEEQKEENSRYLIGKSGKIMRNFFAQHNLVSDFDKEVLVLNKTPIHTPSTGDLKELKGISSILYESQRFMARIIADIHYLSDSDLWLVGCSNLRKKGLFEAFYNEIKEIYGSNLSFTNKRKRLFCFKHFSYGNFSREINTARLSNETDNIYSLLTYVGGEINRKNLFSW